MTMAQANYVDINTLHNQRNHMNEKRLKECYGKKHPEILKQNLRPCESCLIAKAHKANVKKKTDEKSKPKEPLGMIVSDLKTMLAKGSKGEIYAGSAI